MSDTEEINDKRPDEEEAIPTESLGAGTEREDSIYCIESQRWHFRQKQDQGNEHGIADMLYGDKVCAQGASL